MDIMIDIETLANSSNSVIVQIGAAVFDRKSGKIIDTFDMNIDSKSCTYLGMEIDASTVEWWFKQSKEARDSIVKEPKVGIEEALKSLTAFIKNNWTKMNNNMLKLNSPGQVFAYEPRDIRLWCHPSFDEANLDNAYRKVGLETPWHYSCARDLRTVVDLADYEINYEKNYGTAHNALDDCIFQINYLVECLNKIG